MNDLDAYQQEAVEQKYSRSEDLQEIARLKAEAEWLPFEFLEFLRLRFDCDFNYAVGDAQIVKGFREWKERKEG